VKHRHRDPAEDFPPDQIDSDEALDLICDAVLIGNDGLRKLTKQILKHQKRLHRAVDDDGWKAYLKLEEVTNERASAQMDVLVRWALTHGSRSRR
jgi:hypothetical protein